MADITTPIAPARASHTMAAGFGTLAAATYSASSAAIDLSTLSPAYPIDLCIELEATPNGATTGNKQALVFVRVSMDNTNFTTGPTSGTSATDEANLYRIGVLPLNSTSTQQRGVFPLVAAVGFMPRAIQIVVRNDCGVAFSAAAVNITGNKGLSA